MPDDVNRDGWFKDLPRRARNAYPDPEVGQVARLGPGLSAAIRAETLSSSTIFSICLGRARDVDGIGGGWSEPGTLEGVGLRLGLSVGWCGIHNQTDQAKVLATLGYFSFMPNIQAAEIPQGNFAAGKIKECAGAILVNTSRCQANLLPAFAAAWDAFREKPEHRELVLLAVDGETQAIKFGGEEAKLPIMDLTVSRLTLEACGKIFELARQCYTGHETVLEDTIMHYIVAISKRGEITREKGRKIFKELSKTLDRELDFDNEILHQCWKVAGARVNENNASQVIQALTTWVGNDQEVLRLRLTLQQSVQAGLTAIILIRRALIGHPKFGWAKIAQLFPTEAVAVTDAFEQIANNPYYGYAANLNHARSTLYQNITWVCKTLLIEIDGDSTLRQYRGFKLTPKHHDVVLELIREYKARYNTGFMADPEPGNVDVAVNMFEEAMRSNNLASDQSREGAA